MRKKLFIIALYICSCTAIAAQDNCDVNRDGKVNVVDVNMVVNHICGTLSPEDSSAINDTHEFVDLGLTSGTLWATCNIGAKSPEDYGDYFAWGDTQGYSSCSATGHTYEWANYKLMTAGCKSWLFISKYTVEDNQTEALWYSSGRFKGDRKTTLEPADDAATANWGNRWMMPSRAQMKELLQETYNEIITLNGILGMKFTSKKDPDVSIFLPAAGCCSNGSLNNAGQYGFYWMNDLFTGYTDLANMYYFRSDFSSADYGDNRFSGKSVRPVRVSIAKK